MYIVGPTLETFLKFDPCQGFLAFRLGDQAQLCAWGEGGVPSEGIRYLEKVNRVNNEIVDTNVGHRGRDGVSWWLVGGEGMD